MIKTITNSWHCSALCRYDVHQIQLLPEIPAYFSSKAHLLFERHLFHKMQQGNRAAGKMFHQRSFYAVYKYCRQLLTLPQAAEEAVQHVYIDVAENAAGQKVYYPRLALLHVITEYVAGWYGQEENSRRRVVESFDGWNWPLIQQLPPLQKKVYLLHQYAGFTLLQIAKVVDQPEIQVMILLAEALAHMRTEKK